MKIKFYDTKLIRCKMNGCSTVEEETLFYNWKGLAIINRGILICQNPALRSARHVKQCWLNTQEADMAGCKIVALDIKKKQNRLINEKTNLLN